MLKIKTLIKKNIPLRALISALEDQGYDVQKVEDCLLLKPNLSKLLKLFFSFFSFFFFLREAMLKIENDRIIISMEINYIPFFSFALGFTLFAVFGFIKLNETEFLVKFSWIPFSLFSYLSILSFIRIRLRIIRDIKRALRSVPS